MDAVAGGKMRIFRVDEKKVKKWLCEKQRPMYICVSLTKWRRGEREVTTRFLQDKEGNGLTNLTEKFVRNFLRK